MRPLCCAFIAGLLLSMSLASAYTFQENSSVPDSVRLVLNAQNSTEGIVALDVAASQVSNVYSAAFDLDFNSSVLEWAGAFAHDPDGYLKGGFFGASAFYEIGPEIFANGTKNRGKIVAGATGTGSPKTGSGSIMTIKLRVVGSGTTQVSFSNSNLIRPDMSFTSSAWYGGTLVSGGGVPSPPQDDPPAVSLNTADGTVFQSRNVSLACSASDDYGLANITLHTNVTGSWQPYQTKVPGDRVWTESFDLSNLQEGVFRWSCAATDSAGQQAEAQPQHLFRVQLPADPNPPQRSSGQPSGSIAYTNVTISLQTDEAAACRYATVPGLEYGKMVYNFTGAGGTSHSANLSLSDNHSYSFFVRCADSSGNANSDDFPVSFSIGSVAQDTQPPTVTSAMSTGLFAWSTHYISLDASTDEDAFCKFASQGGVAFGSMSAFSYTYFRNHSEIVAGLREGTQYFYYVKCSDGRGNVNPSDTMIGFYVCYEADSDCNRVVSLPEVNAFLSRWYADSGDVNIRRLIESITLWKRGSA